MARGHALLHPAIGGPGPGAGYGAVAVYFGRRGNSIATCRVKVAAENRVPSERLVKSLYCVVFRVDAGTVAGICHASDGPAEFSKPGMRANRDRFTNGGSESLMSSASLAVTMLPRFGRWRSM